MSTRLGRVVALIATGAGTMAVDCDPYTSPVPPPIPSTVQYAVCGPPPVDPVVIQDVWLDGDDVHATVRYKGGCKAHEFTLCWDGGWLNTTPRQTSMFVDHWADGDTCGDWIEESFSWNLAELRADTLSFWPETDRLMLVFPTETLEWRF